MSVMNEFEWRVQNLPDHVGSAFGIPPGTNVGTALSTMRAALPPAPPVGSPEERAAQDIDFWFDFPVSVPSPGTWQNPITVNDDGSNDRGRDRISRAFGRFLNGQGGGPIPWPQISNELEGDLSGIALEAGPGKVKGGTWTKVPMPSPGVWTAPEIQSIVPEGPAKPAKGYPVSKVPTKAATGSATEFMKKKGLSPKKK
jgi:hypothetical protein